MTPLLQFVLSSICAFAVLPSSGVMALRISVDAPKFMNLTAASSPIPLVAPVIRIVLPANDLVGSLGG